MILILAGLVARGTTAFEQGFNGLAHWSHKANAGNDGTTEEAGSREIKVVLTQ